MFSQPCKSNSDLCCPNDQESVQPYTSASKPVTPARASRVLLSLLLMLLIASQVLFAAGSDLPVYTALGGDFELTGTQGKSVSLRDWRGKVIMMTFGFTACPHICPTTLMELTKLQTSLGDAASQVQVVLISIDPQRDTPEQLRRYLLSFQSSPPVNQPANQQVLINIEGLTGTQDQIRDVAKRFGVAYEHTDEIAHSDRIYLLDTQGQVRQIYARQGQFDQMKKDVLQLIPRRGFCDVLPSKISTLCREYWSR